MSSCYNGGCALRESFGYAFEPLLGSMSDAVANVSAGAPWFLPLAAAVVGAVMASMIGVVVERLPRIRGWNDRHEPGLGLASPASHCTDCGASVPAVALIPVAGWFLAGGRCGECGSRVPWRYPAIEAGSAVVTMGVAAFAGVGATGISIMILLWAMLFVSWIDWNEHEIPDGATVPLLFAGLLFTPFEMDAPSRVMGAALAGALVWVAFRITGSVRREDAMSLGDVALAGALGAWAGLCSIPAFLVCSCLAYVAYALPLRRAGQVWVPMGPALCAGMLVAVAYAWIRS